MMGTNFFWSVLYLIKSRNLQRLLLDVHYTQIWPALYLWFVQLATILTIYLLISYGNMSVKTFLAPLWATQVMVIVVGVVKQIFTRSKIKIKIKIILLFFIDFIEKIVV